MVTNTFAKTNSSSGFHSMVELCLCGSSGWFLLSVISQGPSLGGAAVHGKVSTILEAGKKTHWALKLASKACARSDT